MTFTVQGAEHFQSGALDETRIRASVPPDLILHSVGEDAIDRLDPLTYEVIRHRLWSLTDEMGDALKRMSGSAIVTDANDFDFAVSDEIGQEVQVGLYNTLLVGAVDLAIAWTLEHRASNPGVHEGDMFLCNDPWVGGGLHQSDVIVFQPIFVEGELFAWTSAVCHEPDLGGPGIGSFNPGAADVFQEALPTPPVKVVRNLELQQDIADMWIRRSRVPGVVALDLRAKIGANNVGRVRLMHLVEQYGAATVKAVMKRMMSDAELRLRAKLQSVPDGSWTATGYQDQSGLGDRGLHKITVLMTKVNDHLTFDFTGTDPQAGIINCTYGGMRGGVMTAILPVLAGDIPWSAGGLMRCFDLVSAPGTLNNATFPAAISRAPIGPAWLTGTLAAECLGQMLMTGPQSIGTVQASCCGTWDTAVLGGLDERTTAPHPFLGIVMEAMAGGYGAQSSRDGVDTGGLFCIPMGRVPDIEMTELLNPLLALWRREVPDSGGPGEFRGGVSASVAITPYGTSQPVGLVLAAAGKGVSQNNGLAGGYPGNTGQEVIVRSTTLDQSLREGHVPQSLADLEGEAEITGCYAQSYLLRGDVLTMHWQGGGGFGDPLLRQPASVSADLRAGKITRAAAGAIYGVELTDGGEVDGPATTVRRTEIRDSRSSRSQDAPEDRPGGDATQAGPVRRRVESAPGLPGACRNCGETLGIDGDGKAWVSHDGPIEDAGPQVQNLGKFYLDDEVVFRQISCPSCWTVSYSRIVPSKPKSAGQEVTV